MMINSMTVSTFISILMLQTVMSQVTEESMFYRISDILHPATEGGFLMSITASRAECGSHCVRNINCWSFYHNPSDDECFLAPRYQTVVPNTSYSDISQNRFDLFRKPGGYSTCLELLQSNPSATDGDYWLYPTAVLVHYNIVKLYCSIMASGQPKEFVSLPVPNSGEYPKKTFHHCKNYQNYLSGCPGQNGIYSYNKIRVDPHTLSVTRNDRTFVTGSGVLRDYGWAGDCYAANTESYTCGPKGTFDINTVGTGLKVDPSLSWKLGGWKPKIVMVKSQGDAVISLTCGGYDGYCEPEATMFLHLNTADIVDSASATWQM